MITTGGRFRLLGGVSAFAAIALVTGPAFAQEAVESTGIGDIVVTATKRSDNINNVAMSITALGSEALQARGVVDTADLGKVVPGFNYSKGNFGTPVFTLRGVGFFDTSLGASPTVSVYVDETPLPFSIMTRGASLDLERVEVLKGPQGTLFGQNSTGGAINFVAAKPTSDLKAGFDLNYGRFNRIEAQGFVSGPLSDTLRARISMRHEYSDAWQKSYTRNDELGKTDLSIARLLLDWTPSDRLQVKLNVNGWWDRSDTQAGQLRSVSGNPARLLPGLVAYPLPPAGSIRAADWDAVSPVPFKRHDNFHQVALRIDYEISDQASLVINNGYSHFRLNTSSDADGTDFQTFTSYDRGKLRSYSSEVRLELNPSDMLRFTVGGNYQDDHISEDLISYMRDSSFPFDSNLSINRQSVETAAVFASTEWKATDSITLEGGLRYTDQSRDHEGCFADITGDVANFIAGRVLALAGRTITPPVGQCVTLDATINPALITATLKEDNISWRAGAKWKAAPGALLYANISRGYKDGSFPTIAALSYTQLQPVTQESILAYEAGFKLTLLDRTLQLDGAVFYYDYTDKQVKGRTSDLTLGVLSALVNIPKSRIAGAEAQIQWAPVENLRLSGGGTYIGSKIQDNFTNYNALGQLQNFNGQVFPLTPKWQLVGDAEYRQPVSGDSYAFVGINAKYQSKSYATPGELAIHKMPGYTLLDARLGVASESGAWRVSGYVRNLTDKRYINNVITIADTTMDLVGMPRTWGVALSYRY